jgi:hypothetical protein
MSKLGFGLLYLTTFLPVWGILKMTSASRFGRRFHHRASTWDRPPVRMKIEAATGPIATPGHDILRFPLLGRDRSRASDMSR